jgi:DNA-binding NtrC family response regulator
MLILLSDWKHRIKVYLWYCKVNAKMSKKQNMAKVLILDQTKSIRNILRERLEFEGFATTVAEPSEVCERFCSRRGYDAIVAGEKCGEVSRLGLPYIVITSQGSIDGAVMALKGGAEDYLTTPVDMNRLLCSLRKITSHDEESTPSESALLPLKLLLVRV